MNLDQPLNRAGQPIKPFCCVLDCKADAEFHIETHRRDGGIAGPDIYSDDTDACEAHVGELLGWQPEAKDTAEIVWTVYQIH